MKPIAIMSLTAKTAVGRAPLAQERLAGGEAAADVEIAGIADDGVGGDAGRRQRRAEPGPALGLDVAAARVR